MNPTATFTKQYRKVDKKFTQELIRKIMQLCDDVSTDLIADALWDTMPMVTYCREFPEVTKFAYPSEAQKAFDQINEYKGLPKYQTS